MVTTTRIESITKGTAPFQSTARVLRYFVGENQLTTGFSTPIGEDSETLKPTKTALNSTEKTESPSDSPNSTKIIQSPSLESFLMPLSNPTLASPSSTSLLDFLTLKMK